jgi:hypothetical protein
VHVSSYLHLHGESSLISAPPSPHLPCALTLAHLRRAVPQSLWQSHKVPLYSSILHIGASASLGRTTPVSV